MANFTKTRIAAIAFSSLFTANLMAAEQTYQIDPEHTSIIAAWSHFGFSNPTASLSGAKGTITYDPQAPEKASVEVSIPIETIDTYVSKLNSEFIGSEYFDQENFPQATFKSTKVLKTGEEKFDVYGQLTIKGVTRTAIFHTSLNKMDTHPMTKKAAIGFDAHTEIKRSEFGLDKYVPNVGDEVTLTITTEAQAK